MITEKHIIDMYVHLRETNQTIPDEALSFMKRVCLEKLNEINSKKEKVSIEKLDVVHEEYALSYASCDRCSNYIDASSSIFGDSYYCSIENHPHDVYDNDWHFEMGEPIIDCEHFSFGKPKNASEVKKTLNQSS